MPENLIFQENVFCLHYGFGNTPPPLLITPAWPSHFKTPFFCCRKKSDRCSIRVLHLSGNSHLQAFAHAVTTTGTLPPAPITPSLFTPRTSPLLGRLPPFPRCLRLLSIYLFSQGLHYIVMACFLVCLPSPVCPLLA